MPGDCNGLVAVGEWTGEGRQRSSKMGPARVMAVMLAVMSSRERER